MRKESIRNLSFIAFVIGIFSLSGFTRKNPLFTDRPISDSERLVAPADTGEKDSLIYPFDEQSGGLYLNNPDNFKEEVDYDPVTGQYIVTQKIGGLNAKPPMFMTPEEYRAYVQKKQSDEYWRNKTQSAEAAAAEGRDPESSLIPQIRVNGEWFERIFGSNTIDIRPQGYAELRFGGRIQKIDNPIIPERNRTTFNFDFDQRIQMNVTGNIGSKLKVSTNYDTEATFSFENQMKVEFTGDEDDIVKKVELGNVSLPLNSSLISGAQSLFGVKGQFQFGKLTLTTVLSEQRSQSSSVNIQGGATTTDFEIWGDQYEANRHFFLAHYFRDNYERFLEDLPLVTSPVQITKVEVWVTNTRQETQNTRNLVAFMDLGEADGPNAYRSTQNARPGAVIYNRFFQNQGFPDNENNALSPDALEQNYPGVRDIGKVNSVLNSAGFEEATEYAELANARLLRPSEYTFNPQLGYVSLSTSLNQDEILAVAFQFTAGGKTYQVGEFSNDGITPPQNLVLKMLKSTVLNVRAPMWDLMMKNIYSLGAYQVNREDFRLDVLYQNDETGVAIPFLPEGNLKDQLLVRVMELDQLNVNNDAQPDGFFDFVNNITINAQTGRVIFPVLEPFGSNLNQKLTDPEVRDRYVYQELYDSTRFKAQNETRLNKFLLRGQFKSAGGSRIQLNAFNIPRGSVTVTAGGAKLVEDQDYRVDYNAGSIQILNEGLLESGTPIKVDFENNALFNVQTRIFTGINADYRFNDHLNMGATMVRLAERPLTQKVNIGDEPIANTILGVNGNYSNEAPYLTRLVDKIPFIDTKAKSNITIQGEAARLIPGSPTGIKLNGEETTYLDDFESSQTSIDIKNPIRWVLASVPGNQPDLFPEAANNDRTSGYNRAKLAWYAIDPLLQNSEARTPQNLKDNNELQSLQYSRRVTIKEVFPNLQQDASQVRNIATLDLAFYPEERGPYNYDVEPTSYSAGMNSDGELNAPRSRWGGMMTDLSSTNFEEQNIEFIQFWMLDPNDKESYQQQQDPGVVAPNRGEGGYFYINLGSVSEDILKDGQQAIENARPTNGDVSDLQETPWGYVGTVRPPVIAFDNDLNSRASQDLGYDMLTDSEEESFAAANSPSYLQRIENAFGGRDNDAYRQASGDPAADNFSYFRGAGLDNAGAGIQERYKNYNNPEGNSIPVNIDGVSAFASNLPNIEDVNGDQTLSKTETYYQYRISLNKNDLEDEDIGTNYITDIQERITEELPNGQKLTARWIQFKVPIFSPDKKVGPINDFRSIRFIRTFIQGVSQPITLRFARMELVRGEWRRYRFDLGETSDGLNIEDNDNTLFEVNAVNIEQNGEREPINYVLPPGIQREVLFGTASSQQQNEQALSLRVQELEDGDARAVFRNLNFDMRLYKKLKMFVHAEEGINDPNINPSLALEDNEINVFIRVGSDYNLNYYEYELPLKTTLWGETDPNLIWPAANDVDFELNLLKQVKLERDRAYRASGTANSERYTATKGRAKVSVVGSPNLSNVRTILIGIRNPRKRNVNDNDRGRAVNAEVWVNELRLAGFDQDGGYAANARVAAQLADFANVSLSGRMSTVGFGSLDQSVSERQQEQVYAYDLQTSVNLDKFFPQDLGLRIPMFFSKSEEWRTPRFNPLDPDIEFDQSLDNLETEAERDELRKNAQDYTARRSINFTNVRKDRVTKPGEAPDTPMPWDIENFSASYAFNEQVRRNISTVMNNRTDHMGSLNYTYQTRPKPVEPFKNVGFLSSKYLQLIKDFNFYYYPKNFTVIGTLNRSLTEMQMRNVDNFNGPELPITYNRNFTFNRQYTLLYDLSRSLTLDFNAQMNTRIDELADTADFTRTERNDEIWSNIKDLGRPTNYHQTTNINWKVPIDKLPPLDFITVQARYQADYDWSTNSLRALDEDPLDPKSKNFGSVIQNNMQLQLNNNFNLVGLYNKIPYFKRVNQGSRPERATERRGGLRTSGRGKSEEEEEDKEEESTFQKILAGTVRTLMMVKNGSVNYTKNEGTVLPGFIPTPVLAGMDNSRGFAPGPLFTLGDQADIRDIAVENDWLTRSALLNTPYTRASSENITARASVEPLNSLRITLTGSKNTTSNLQEFFRFDTTATNADGGLGAFVSQNPFYTETYTMSYISIRTAFDGSSDPDNPNASRTYQQFLDNRFSVSSALSSQYAANNPGYSREIVGEGDTAAYRYFGLSSQDVMIPAFLAAYSGSNIDGFNTGYKRSIPLPNWNITYDGLSKINLVKKWFNSMVLTHNYRSTYTVSNITTNLLRTQELEDRPGRVPLDNAGNLLSENLIGAVIISEQFAPFLGVNMKLKNSMTLRLEYKKDRNVTLSLSNAQITETKGSEWVIGAGYIIKNVKLKFIRLGKSRTNPVSNLEIKADLGIRDNVTVIRRIVEGTETPTAGQRVINMKLSADYQMSKRVQTKLFYDMNLSTFKTSNAYPISTHLFGISLRLNLGS